MRIRDLTAFAGRLDAPAWRAPLPDVTEVAPGWRRHDRTHLEINLEVAADGRERTWEAWIFLPQSFRLHPATYTERQMVADLHSQTRLSVPPLDTGDIATAVAELVEELPSHPIPERIGELKLFASRVREATAVETYQVRLLEPGAESESEMLGLVERVGAGLAAVREELVPAADELDHETAQTSRWVDEHLSRVYESAVIKLVRDLDERSPTPEVRDTLAEAAILEARYRVALGAGPLATADSTTRELERVERRQHALKRLTSSVLWLHSEVRDARRGVENGLHAIAAGIAMAFAVTAALLYGTPNDATDLWVWAGLVVLAYMGKDRIKFGLQGAFSRYIDRRYPNRRCTILDQSGETRLATATEKVRYVGTEEIPSDVASFRADVHRDALRETVEAESTLHHRKTLLVDAAGLRTVDPRFRSLTEIFRIDISRWLANTDDPTRTVTLADPLRGELFESALPRAYDVTIVYRFGPTGEEAPLTAARVVVSRKGIRRVDQLAS